MNKIEKAVAKLPKEYKTIFDFLMHKLLARDFSNLHIKKLSGHKDIYRLKHGRLRVIFHHTDVALEVLDAGLRNEKTYRNF